MAIDAKKHEGQVVDVVIQLALGHPDGAVPVRIRISPHALQVRRVGKRGRCGLSMGWGELLARMTPPASAPAKYLADPASLVTGPAATT